MKRILFYCLSVVLTILVSYRCSTQNPKYKIGDFAYGGIVAWTNEDGTKGLVCSPYNLDGKYNWEDARKKCEELELGSYNDWHLPSYFELTILHDNLFKNGLGDFKVSPLGTSYWSSNIGCKSYFEGNTIPCSKNFEINTGDSNGDESNQYSEMSVRPIRTF